MKQLLNHQPLTIFGDGNQTRAFSYIDDVAPIIAKSVFNELAYNQVFNIGSDEVTTVNEIAELICKAFNVPSEIKHLRQRNEVKHAYSEHKKIKECFGIIAETKIRDGISKMSEWTLNNSNYLEQSKPFKTEISHGLPEGW